MSAVTIARSEAERADAFAVRHAVFVAEQGVPEDLELDEYDDEATHFVAYDGGEAVGAARLRGYEGDDDTAGDPRTAKVERVAVLEARRGEGWGRRLMDRLEATAREQGYDRLTMHSQTHAAGFYEQLGYERQGSEFEEAGIPHVEMAKRL